jgi:glycosyltransferase involved in cell wall biosynthesis
MCYRALKTSSRGGSGCVGASQDRSRMLDMRVKVGIFLDVNPDSGGAFQYSQTMLGALSKLSDRGIEAVAVYTDPLWRPIMDRMGVAGAFARKGFWSLPATRRIAGRLPMNHWRSLCPRFHPVAKTMARLACDLWIFPAQDTWTYLMPFPAIGVVFDLMHRYERRFPEVSAHGIYASRERHYRRMCRFTEGLLADSEVGKRQVVDSYGVDPGRVFVLPFTVPEHIASVRDKAVTGRLPLKYVFYPAQFWLHKNHQRLIESVARLRPKLPDLNLVLVGSRKNGYETAAGLVARLKLTDCVHFLGYVPDAEMAPIYRGARAMIMPTFFGPTNIPPLEAMALGCPMAVSNIYGMPEQLGEAAIYFDPARTEAIAGAIERLWVDDHLCRELTRKGLERAAQWTPERFRERLEDILRICRRRNPSRQCERLGARR